MDPVEISPGCDAFKFIQLKSGYYALQISSHAFKIFQENEEFVSEYGLHYCFESLAHVKRTCANILKIVAELEEE